MSLVLDIYCENPHRLLDEGESLPDSRAYSAKSEKIPRLMFSLLEQQYTFADGNIFELLESKFGIEDRIFGQLHDCDHGLFRASDVASYLKKLLTCLVKKAARLPMMYSFRHAYSSDRLEQLRLDGSRHLQAGYDHCVLVDKAKNTAIDLRRQTVVPAREGAPDVSIDRQTIDDYCGEDFQQFLNVAATAEILKTKLVFAIS